MRTSGAALLQMLLGAAFCFGQTIQPAAQPRIQPGGVVEQRAAEQRPAAAADPSYVLGPGDQVVVRVMDAEQFTDRALLIDMSGFVRLPMAGRVKMGGLTIAQAEADVTARLKTYYLKPDVSITIAEYGSQPVSVVGSVRTPGVHQVRGRKTLVEVLSLAGGVDNNAGSMLKITRRIEYGPIPLRTAVADPGGEYSVAEVNLKQLMEARNPEDNIAIKPHDVISVPKAETVYVMGQVIRAGGYVLNDRKEASVLQALSMAGGLDRMAKPQEARIIRPEREGSARQEIAVDLRKIIEGKAPDPAMKPDDILFVPDNIPKRAVLRTLEAAVQMGTGIVIWRHP